MSITEQALVATRKERHRMALVIIKRYEDLLKRRRDEELAQLTSRDNSSARRTALERKNFLKGQISEVKRLYRELTGREMPEFDNPKIICLLTANIVL